MFETSVRDAVALWFESGVPARMVADRVRWRVIDEPTPLTREPDWLPPQITHAPAQFVGWRFTARSDQDGLASVFDVHRDDAGRWHVAHRYD